MPYENQFAALSHPLRQQILNRLETHPASVRELTDQLAASQPVVSQHLKVLREAGLISATPAGMKRIYRIEPGQLAELRSYLERHWLNALTDLAPEDSAVDGADD
ncbi:ArsR/SmtB family transcription factor [Flavimaricola marinus]|uniref:HTH-type transcriptional regulator n=1 Tax=Flavimaricola marinus TaxID=1819565 RepID=A0A238LGF1_9RHOB|nr:metalloregulator ArsR/SmtB family transcription factor [Flavimaricola marinus]SMY08678.1 HTH-type transcriptional regulator [Flavimaricola marinus]